MVADISVPIPFGDYEMIARGTWWVEDNQMSVKITRSSTGEMTLSGTARRGINIQHTLIAASVFARNSL